MAYAVGFDSKTNTVRAVICQLCSLSTSLSSMKYDVREILKKRVCQQEYQHSSLVGFARYLILLDWVKVEPHGLIHPP